MINQSELETIDSSMTPPPKDVLSYSVSQNPVASELDGDSIDSSIQNALAETASNQSKKTPISIPVQELTPIERAVNEYAKINNARNKTALNQSLVSASAKDPDTAAKSQALATNLNVSTGVVDFDIELAKRQMLLRKAEAMKLAEKYPSLAKMFLNQDFAEIAHDDIDNLAKTSDISRRLIATEKSPSDSLPLEFDPIRTANYYATNTLEGFKSDWERGYKSGDITDRSSKLGYSAFTSPGSELRDAYIFQAENLKSKTEEYLETWTESLAELVGQMAPMTVEAVATGVVASGGTALAASIFPPAELPLVPGAFAAGFAGSMSYQSYEIETGASYLDLRKGDEDYEPMSHEEAAAIAPTVGLINAVLETASNLFFFIPGAKLANYALKKTVKETVSKSLRKATVGKLARSAAVRVLKTGTLETVTEVLQTIVPKIVQEANVPEGRMSAFDTEEGRKRFADEIAVTIEKTFKGAFLLGLIPGGAKFIHERSILNRSIQQQEEITNLIDNAKESKVNKRSKPTYNSYLAQQLSGESLHIGVDQFEQIRKKSEVSLEELERIIPGITEQVAKEKASGGDVVIPTSLYLSELIDTEFGVSIRNDIRADAEGMSINEIAESQEFLKELKSINKQAIEDFKKTNKDWAESAGKIEEEVFAKIKAAGNYTEEEARMLAQFHRDIAVVLASRFGMTPEQFNAKFGLSIESAYTPEQQAPAQGSFGQAQIAKMDSDYMAAVESGDVVEQQRMVDEATSSPGWYSAQHGTPTKQKISVFGNRGGLTGAESAKKAFFFSDRSGVTDTYRLFKRGVPNEKAINEWIDGLSPKELIRVLTRDVYFNPDKLNDAQEIEYVKEQLKEEAGKFNEVEGTNYVIDEIIQKAKNSSIPFPSEIDPKNIGQTLKVKLKITNPFYFTQEDAETFGIDAIVTKAIADGHDGIISSERVADSIASPFDDKDPPSGVIYAVFNPEQIKSADPVTRDESGKVVPLSRRFNLSSPNTFEQASRADLGLGQQAAFSATDPNMLRQEAVPAAFYSALSVEVGKLTIKSASAESWKQQIKGLIAKGVIKEREVFWSGLNNWLDLQEGKITKEQVQAFLAAGGVKVELTRLEERKGQEKWYFNINGDVYDSEREAEEAADSYSLQQAQDKFDSDSSINDSYLLMREGETIETFYDEDEARQALAELEDSENAFIEEKYELILEGDSYGVYGDRIAAQQSANDIINNWADAIRRDMDVSKVDDDDSNASKFSAYQLPGGTNYREVLVTLPKDALGTRKIMDGDKVVAIAKNDAFKSSHWDQPNVLVHLRLNDRVDANGKQVLFVEEVQSDWGQEGREKGFSGETQIEIEKLIKQKEQAEFDAEPYTSQGKDAPKEILDRWNFAANRIQSLRRQEVSTVPVAPFVETTSGWLELGLKQIMLEAVNGKYDRVAFVDGDQSVERYRKALTQAVDEVEIQRNDDGTYTYNANKGGGTIQREASVSAKRIGEVFGKAGSKQLLEQADANPNDIHTISSEDIEIGGEGMRKFYDTIVPQALSKMLKKLGGDKVGEVEIDTRRPEDNAYYADLTEADTMRQQGFTVTPALAAQVNQGLPLFQSAQNKPARGFFNPKQLKMMLGSKSDFTTFIHELAHYNLTVLGRIASDPQSPSQIREDMDTTLSWFGIAGETPEQRLANWNAMTLEEQRRHHETFAYNHEIYLSEGKSPSIEMQGVFERFSQFVKRIYISIRDDLNAIYKQEFGTDLPMMTGEIRRVMDRMIATDEQIRSAEERRNMENIFKDQELSGMDDAQWASYQQMRAEATQKSVSELNEQSLAATTWASRLKAKKVKEIEAEQEELRSEIRKQVKKEVESRNVYRAIKFLKYGILQTAGGEEVEFTGSNKLNTNAVKLMVPKENMDKFGSGKNGMVALDGYHPDIVSEMFNYSSGDELILAILDAKPVDEVIDGITEDRMEIENGELNSPQAIEAAADKAVHNEARVKLVAVELRWLTKATQPVRAMIAAAKSVAKQMLETKRLRDIKPGDYASAAARAAKESQTAYFASQSAETAAKTAYTRHYNKMIAEGVEETKAVEMATKVSDEALAKAESRSEAHKKKYGKMKPSEVAAQAKRSQLLQEQLALEAKEVKDEIKSQIKKFKRFFENDKKIAKTRNMDLVNAARSILAFYGLGKHNKLPSAYLEQLKEYNPNLFETVFAMVTRAQIGTPDYQSLTVEEFRSMKETVDALWELANRENQIRVEGEVVLVNQAVDELNARIDEIGVPTKIAGETQAVTGKDRLVRHINSTKAILRRVQNWADATDGANNVVGPFTKYIWRPISQALNAYRIDRNKYVKRYVELLKEIALPVGKIVAPELNYTFGADNGGIGIAELLGAIMHSGNISNLEKLLIGRKWATVSEDGTMDTSRWYAFVARVTNDGTLTKQHFDFIQATWDLNEELKPMAQKAHHDIEGYYFKEVEATPFTNQFGTYRGGYVPAKTDPFIVRDAQRQAKMSELESDFRAAMPSTGAGFTESRVKYNKPLSLDIRLIAKHIDDVIRYSHVQPAVKDVMRILNKRSFADKLTRMDSMAIDEMIIPWLNRSARQITSDPGRSKWVDNFWRTIRSRTGMAIMIGNIRNALQQPTGLFMSATKVKPSNLGNAFLAYLSSPHKTAQEVSSLSSFMSNKLENQIFDLQNAMNELLLNPNAYKKIERWTLHHAYFLQSAFQNMADIVTWVGAYNQYLEESGVGVSNADAQKEAVNRADAAVQLTQGTRNPESIAAFEVGTPFYQTFIQFTGYYSMLANLNTDEYVKIFRDLGWRGNKGKLVYTFLMGFAAQAIVSDAIVRTLGGGWEDDDDDGYLDVVMDWIFGSMARSAVAMVPFGSSAYTALTTAYNNKPYDDRITSSPSISALESSTVGVGKAIINVVSEDKEITGQNVKDVATLISVSTGIPMTLLGRPASYLVDVERGAVEPTSTADLVRGLITGTASKESKK